MNDKELISEARGAFKATNASASLIARLADALEARQPTESDREALDKIVTEYDMALYTKEETLDRLSRAAVPDAATEGDYHEGLEEGIKIGRAERDAALAAIERIRQAVSGHPECDRYEEGDVISCGWKSAYAGVVAALDGAPEPEWEYGSGPEDALDQSGLHTSRATAERGVVEWNEFTQRSERMGGRPLERLVLVRRRKAGPWLPVDGEKP